MKLVIQNVYSAAQKARVDVLVEDGVFRSIAGANTLGAPAGGQLLNGAEYVLLPALVDGHGHLDKTIMGLEWFSDDRDFDLQNCISRERRLRHEKGIDPYTQATRYMDMLLELGVLYMRSHVDVDVENGLAGVEGLLRAKEEYKDKFGVQLVAFPQSGLLRLPGSVEMMDEALKLGVDVVGGLDPADFDGDPVASVDAVFKLAEKHQKPVDIHLHEERELGLFTMGVIAQRAAAAGMQGKVTVSHAFCLAAERSMVEPMLDKLAKAGVGIATAASPSAGSPLVPVRLLRAHGVAVVAGNDNVNDLWAPFGSGDMLERAQLLAIKNGLRKDEDLELALELSTTAGAQLLGLGENAYGIAEGRPAKGVLVKARNAAEAVARVPRERIVLNKNSVHMLTFKREALS